MPSASSVDFMDSAQIQARHYKTLQEICKSKNPNKIDVAHLLDLEFEGRRRFIDSDVSKEQDRGKAILKAYPCFKEIDHVSNLIRNRTENCNYSKELYWHEKTYHVYIAREGKV